MFKRRYSSPGPPLPLALLHWTFATGFAISLTTGLRIAVDAPDRPFQWLRDVLPQGAVYYWHLVSALLLTASAVAYGVFLFRSRRAGRLQLRLNWVRVLGRLDRGWWIAANRALHWLLFTAFAVASTTGLLLYSRPPITVLPALEILHRWTACVLLIYVLLHIPAQLTLGIQRLVGLVRPQPVAIGAGVFAVAAGVLCGLTLLSADRAIEAELYVLELGGVAPPELDGRPDDPAWELASAATVQTTGGANLESGGSRVTMRAVRNDDNAWFLFTWTDPTRSLKHLPLVKREDGWHMLQNGFWNADEVTYYEDKLAVLLSASDPRAALRSIHLGPRPIPGRIGSLGKRGLHYTTDGSVLDLWHWQAVRGEPHRQLEDGYFGPPRQMPREAPLKYSDTGAGDEPGRDRYAGGYGKDRPMSWEIWEVNWEAPTADRVIPRRLPEDPADFAALSSASLAPGTSDQGHWAMYFGESRPYAPEHDSFPVGTVLPGVILTEPGAGDRADVAGRATWAQGQWRLEVRRALDTQSGLDVPLKDGTLLWVAVFDHAQTRHSMHLRPIRLRLL